MEHEKPEEIPLSPAEQAFESFLLRRDAGESFEIDQLCRDHPELTGELLALQEAWQRLGGGTETDRPPPSTRVPPPAAAAPMSTDVGAVLARLGAETEFTQHYSTEAPIARGGMGEVLAVFDHELSRRLAMKILIPRDSKGGESGPREVDGRLLARFVEEARIAARLDHPGIAPVHELGLTPEGRVYFTMKLVAGASLVDVFEKVGRAEDGWSLTRALGVLLRVCEAMAYAHQKGVVHRDLKPANVMVGRFGEVYVMDWGLARLLDEEQASDTSGSGFFERPEATTPPLTLHGEVLGTPHYMSPEQAQGRLDEMGPHSDVYSVGAMLYQLLTARMPYVDTEPPGSYRAVVKRVKEEPPRPLRELVPRTPPELVAICDKAMARSIGARYLSMKALARDLSDFLEGRVVRTYRTGAWAELKTWVVRNRHAAVASSLFLATLFGGFATSTTLFVRVSAKEREAVDERLRANGAAEDAWRATAEARAQALLAEERRAEAEAARTEVLRMADERRLRDLIERADALWPAVSSLVPELTRWSAEADELLSRREEHVDALAKLRARALPWTEAEQAHDRATHPLAVEVDALRAKRAERAEWAEKLAQGDEDLQALIARKYKLDHATVTAETFLANVREMDVELERWSAATSERRTFSFASLEEQWRHDVLAKLVADLGELASEGGAMADVQRRLDVAGALAERSTTGPDAAARWEEAIASISESPLYEGLVIRPQIGLLPLREDPGSGLWEFAHLLSGESPAIGPSGELALEETSGIVLVLIPGGTFLMGAQREDPTGPNHDPAATEASYPPHAIDLDPYLLAKHEITQAQWDRITGSNPSHYRAGTRSPRRMVSFLDPVESVSWTEAERVLRRVGLALPTEAQWERAARGGTQTPWWTGATIQSLQGAENICDSTVRAAGAPWSPHEPELTDEYVEHAPVGTFRPNPFGLHDMLGNVAEWCRDAMETYARSVRPGDGERLNIRRDVRVLRGGCYDASAARSTVAYRQSPNADFVGSNIGVRAARAIER